MCIIHENLILVRLTVIKILRMILKAIKMMKMDIGHLFCTWVYCLLCILQVLVSQQDN